MLWLYQLSKKLMPKFNVSSREVKCSPHACTESTLPTSPPPQPLHGFLNSPDYRHAVGNLDSTSISYQMAFHFKMFFPLVGFGDTRDSSLGGSKLPFQKSSSRFQRDNSNRQASELESVTPRTLYPCET